MSDVIISVENLSKSYLIAHQSARPDRYVALRDVIGREIKNFIRRTSDALHGRQILAGDTVEEFWALKDVSFELKRGEALGIVGRNGAGKSTLLKILSRITEPTKGRVTLRGRVASLLEVGTGFHPELTGRENIFLNGTILGMTRADIRRKLDEIIAFAELEEFIDTPVKRYSSGMYVRLAFAVAAHLDPDILIVDEVLAVGDVEFQKKCLNKIQTVSSQSGRTVLFVSHNMAALATLCGRAVLLNRGQILKAGPTDDVIAAYQSLTQISGSRRERQWESVSCAPGDDRVRVRKIELIAEEADPHAALGLSTPFSVAIEYWNFVEDANLVIELILRTADGTVLFHSLSSEAAGIVIRHPIGLYRAVCTVPGNLLNEGVYAVDVHFLHGSMSKYTSLEGAIDFVVQDTTPRGDFIYLGRFIGPIHPRLRWQTSNLVDVASADSSA